MDECALSVALPVGKLALVCLEFTVDSLPMTGREVVLPFSFVSIAIGTNIHPFSARQTMDEVTLVHRSIFFYVFSFSFTEIIFEEATNHVSILVSNFPIPIRDTSIGITNEVGAKVVDELVAFVMVRGAESFLHVLVATQEMALIAAL